MNNKFLLKEGKLYNGTAIPVTILSNAVYEPKKHKWIIPEGMRPELLCVIRVGEKVLRAVTQTNKTSDYSASLEIERNVLLPIFNKKVQYCDPIPEGYDIVIVSSLYANAYQKMYGEDTRLYTISDTVFSEDGRTILGSRGICPAF